MARKKPTDYGDLSKYWKSGPGPVHEIFKVVVDYVKVRSMPSTQSPVRGTVKKDEIVRGEVREDYLLLSTELSKESLMSGDGRWLLIDGASVPSLGVGMLLTRVGESSPPNAAKADPTAQPSDKKMEVAKKIPKPEEFGDLRRFFDVHVKRPVLKSYKVVVEYVMIRSMPSIKSLPQGRLKAGEIVRGQVRGEFLLVNPELSKERLLKGEGMWVLIDGSSEPSLKVGVLLQPVTSESEAGGEVLKQARKVAQEARQSRKDEEEARQAAQVRKEEEEKQKKQLEEAAAAAAAERKRLVEEAERIRKEEEARQRRILEEAQRKRRAEEALRRRLEQDRLDRAKEEEEAAASPKEEFHLKAAAEKAGTDVARYVISMVSNAKNHYETLGVRPTATRKEIRKAYRYISLKIHPDKVQGTADDEELKTAAESTFKLVAAAYEVLEDHSKRASYDARRPGGQRQKAQPTSGANSQGSKSPPAHQSKPEPEFKEPVKVAIRVKHAIFDEEVLLAINHGQTAYFLKQAVATKVKRGPWFRLELAYNSGAPIPESYAFTTDDTIYTIGLRLGPPQEVRLKLVHASTGLVSFVLVRDTATIAEVRTKIVEELHFERKRVLLGERGKKERSFIKFPDSELLNGRMELLINGVDNVVQLTLQEGTQLQDELLEVYADPQFQEDLTNLLEKHGADCLADMSFREAFGKLVRAAQSKVLPKWGFAGERGAHHMLLAFQGIGHELPVQEKSYAIDKVLKVTYGGNLPPPPRKPRKDKRGGSAKDVENLDQEVQQESASPKEALKEEPAVPVKLTIRQAYTDDVATPSNILEVVVPSNATYKFLRETIAAALGGGKACKPRLVRAYGKSLSVGANTYVAYPDTATIKDKREFLIMGATIPENATMLNADAQIGQLDGQVMDDVASPHREGPTDMATSEEPVPEADAKEDAVSQQLDPPMDMAPSEAPVLEDAAAQEEEAILVGKPQELRGKEEGVPHKMRDVLVSSIDGKFTLPLTLSHGSLMADLRRELMLRYSPYLIACELRLVWQWSRTLFLSCKDEEALPESGVVLVMGLDWEKALDHFSPEEAATTDVVDSSEFEPEAEPS